MLPQSEASLTKLINIKASDYNSIYHIDKAILSADLGLLRKFPDIRPKLQKNMDVLDTRVRVSTMQTGELWEALWQHSASGEGKGFDGFDYSYGKWIIKELSSRKDFPWDRFFEKISREYPVDYSGWDDTYLCVMAGELKAEDAIPFLIRSLKIDGDFLCERAAEALSKIGTEKAVEAIAREYLDEDFHFRIYSISALENIKTEASEVLMMELLPKEKDVSQKTGLAHGLCKLFSAKGLPLVLSLLKYGYDTTMLNLETAVYVNHVVNGLEHPDMQRWKDSIARDEQRMRESRKMMASGDLDISQIRENFQDFINRMEAVKKLNEAYAKGFKTGRNAPCPCGSGKKYKRCCGR